MSQTKKHPNNFWLLLSLAIVCGLAAGILGESLSRNYLIKESSSFSGEVNLSNLNTIDSGLIIRDAKKVVVNQDVKISEAISNVRPVLVGVFKEVPDRTPAESRLAGYYQLDNPLFIGLVITADGWVVAAAPEDTQKELKAKSYVAVSGDKQVYKIDKFSTLSGPNGDNLLVFHLSGASNLPVKKIVSRSELSLGQTLLVIKGLDSVWPTTLTALTKSPSVQSSDFMGANLALAGGNLDGWEDAFVFNLAGDLVALVSNEQKVIPAFSYHSSWQSLVKGETTKSPYLGVNYLDLSVVKTEATSLTKGAWLYPTEDNPAILAGSPAAAVGLQADDIITWVNNQELDASHDLAEVVSSYKPGDSLILTYWRGSEEKEVTVKLGSAADK